MNERIKKLIQQSYDEMNEPNNDPSAREWLMNDLLPEYQRLTELILLEVQLLIADERIKYHSEETDDALVRVSISIETHFGVTG
jgi:hypothetical protein